MTTRYSGTYTTLRKHRGNRGYGVLGSGERRTISSLGSGMKPVCHIHGFKALRV